MDSQHSNRAAALNRLRLSKLKSKAPPDLDPAPPPANGSSKYFSASADPTPSPSLVLVPTSSSPAPSPPSSYKPLHKTASLPPARPRFDPGGLGDDVMPSTFPRPRLGPDEPAAKRRNLGTNGWIPSPADTDDPPRIKRAPLYGTSSRSSSDVKPSSSDVEMVEETPVLKKRALNPQLHIPATSTRPSGLPSFKTSSVSSPPSPGPSSLKPGQDTRLTRLQSLHPDKSLSDLEALLKACGGDMAQVTRQLNGGRPSSPISIVTSPLPPAAVKPRRNIIQSPDVEKRGKRSAIYQNTQTMPVALSASAHPTQRTKRKLESDDEEEGQDAWSDDDSDDEGESETLSQREAQAVEWFNEAEPKEIVEVTVCKIDQANIIASLRPFVSPADIRKKLAKKKGVSARVFEDYVDMLQGYAKVDTLLTKCEAVGKELMETVGVWGDATSVTASAAGSRAASVSPDAPEAAPPKKAAEELQEPPSTLQDITLKDYQVYGLSWLYLLYRKGLSCILADEMGLGKTIQVIALYALLKQQGVAGRHLIIVPSSTLENWLREFRRFAPGINVQSYYGSQSDRQYRREDLRAPNANWDVLITTYNLAQGTESDRKFFSKKVQFLTCVFDEGHVLKNYQSQRYQNLMQIKVPWRLMLTGTPLQNNLQELVSLLNFLLPKYFAEAQESLRAIFKVKADSSASFLSRERVSRAKTMMTPFVLRRRKDQVLRDLPAKSERIQYCSMTPLQTEIYRSVLQRSRRTLEFTSTEDDTKKPPRTNGKAKSDGDTSSHVLMDLRKAACHPMLFRRRFHDDKVKLMARHCLREPEFASSDYPLVVEDMKVMTDAELQVFCQTYKSVEQHKLDEHCWLEAGKVEALLSLISQYRAQGRRILVFSQFVQVLDILQHALNKESIRFLVFTGSTAVDERQSLVDEFSENEDIPVFLLSTKAGGMGINLTAASVVIIFDQDFNPHNDRQAADRAYRIGQTRDVEVVKFITRDTIEEDMLRLGQTKLALDVAVAGGDELDEETSKVEKIMKATLLGELRKKLETSGDNTFVSENGVTGEPHSVNAAEVVVPEGERGLSGRNALTSDS